eukprot:CAMPEP_0198109222 /NCGR_PEP_ID=MMETSP1442-20131203/1239_1 /TAXON_ID= /ORGANISM="Craspedostauros australis, Strain CCMP3328" /LENGTH=115 /DNA_ID=CAMNT_0043764785 /DNA_START=107 /DNA_END=454 /DNA_ORIENTATION=+
MGNGSANNRTNSHGKTCHGPWCGLDSSHQQPRAPTETYDAVSETEIQHMLDGCIREIGRSNFFRDLQSHQFGDVPQSPLHTPQPATPVHTDARSDTSPPQTANDETEALSFQIDK